MKLTWVDTSTFNKRFRVTLEDGASVEVVHYRNDTLCVSSQVGCAVGCPFCASGAQGLLRPLRFEELWGQVEAVRALGLSVARVTVSGVGEPLHNLDAVLALLAACRAQRIAPSVTTSGGPLPRLVRMLHAPHNGLTVSVHAGSETVRARLVPKGPGLDALFGSLTEHLPALSRSRLRKVALSYLVLSGENDGDEEIDAFAARVRPLSCAVHLYAYNPVASSAHLGVTRERYEAIYERLRAHGLVVRMSSQARREPNGGCGTLLALTRPAAEDSRARLPGRGSP